MGILKKTFGWIFNAYERPVDSIDIEEIEIKLDAIEKLRPALEREIKAAYAEHRDAYSFEINAVRSPVARKLALQRAAIAARRFKTYTTAVTMMNKVTTVFEELKGLKQFYIDFKDVNNLPKGITIDGLVKSMADMQAATSDKMKQLNNMLESVDDNNKRMEKSMDIGGEDDEKLIGELGALYDQYNTKVAENDTAGTEAIKTKIERKHAEIDEQMRGSGDGGKSAESETSGAEAINAQVEQDPSEIDNTQCADAENEPINFGAMDLPPLKFGSRKDRRRFEELQKKIANLEQMEERYSNDAVAAEAYSIWYRKPAFSFDTPPADRARLMREYMQFLNKAKVLSSQASIFIAQRGEMQASADCMMISGLMAGAGLTAKGFKGDDDWRNEMDAMNDEIQELLTSTLGGTATPETDELEQLFARWDAETDPVKKAEIKKSIEAAVAGIIYI